MGGGPSGGGRALAAIETEDMCWWIAGFYSEKNQRHKKKTNLKPKQNKKMKTAMTWRKKEKKNVADIQYQG